MGRSECAGGKWGPKIAPQQGCRVYEEPRLIGREQFLRSEVAPGWDLVHAWERRGRLFISVGGHLSVAEDKCSNGV